MHNDTVLLKILLKRGNNMYDVIIIGGGPAGLSAALYTLRYGLKTLIIEELYLGGQIVNIHEIENYPGVSRQISGFELTSEMEAQAKRYGAEIIRATVTGITTGSVKTVQTTEGSHECEAVILATGQKPKELGLTGEKELRGRGVSYCATCDGMFFRGKDVAVVGGGDTAVTEAAFLSNFCKKVYLIHRRDTFRAAKAEIDKISQKPNVELVVNSSVTKLLHEDVLTGLEVSTKSGDSSEASVSTISVSAIFIAVGAIPNTKAFEGIITLDESGYILTDEHTHTNVEGIFAAGDIRQKPLRQIVTAASDGAVAAHSALKHITSRM